MANDSNWQFGTLAGRQGVAVEPAANNAPRPEAMPDTSHGETLDSPPASGRPADPNSFAFLDPPQDPGYLGRLGPYRVLRMLGKGGMGIVFECEDSSLGRRVAVKVLRPEIADAMLRKRFLREARLAAALSSEYLAHVYQVGEHNGLPFLAMEFLQGESLESKLQRDGRLPVPACLAIARQVAEGLRVAHDQGLIHRDIKPANLWLDRERAGSDSRRVKILDFGLARPLNTDDGLTSHDNILGTPRYMAPEQVRGETLDARADLYALGSTLYQMLTGQAPFDGKNVTALLLAVVSEDAPSPRKLSEDIPEPVADLVLALLSKSPEDRPASAAAVIERIRAIEEGRIADSPTEPQRSRPARKPAEPAVRPPVAERRRPPLALLGGLAAVLLAAVAGIVALAFRGGSATPDSSSAASGIPTGADPIKIGIIHSLTGTFAASGRPLVDALAMAVEEVNQNGGVLGRRLDLIVEDGCSDSRVFAQAAEKLITQERVAVLFACYGSSNRKRVAEVCEQHDRLLFYYADYEGLEQSPNVIYVCGSPNQQFRPSLEWAVRHLDRRSFFLVGSDYVYSRVANAVLKDYLADLGHLKARVVGEKYEPLDSSDFAEIVQEIHKTQPDMILNTLEGGSNVAFLNALRGHASGTKSPPILWFGFGEEEMTVLNPRDLQGDYIAAHYFQTLESKENAAFVARFRSRFPTRRVTDSMLAAHTSVHLWKQAAEQARSLATRDVREALRGMSLETAEGKITLDPTNLHAWRTARVGKVGEHLRVQVEFTSPGPIKPEPFPPSRSRTDWTSFLNNLYQGWNQRWEAPRRAQ